MQYVNFGTAGLKVSRIALGLGLRGQGDTTAAEQLIHAALDNGINLFDCANIYGLMDDRRNIGTSELLLGKALKGHRDDVVITSKVTATMGTGPNDAGSSRYHILREVERSLTRLDTDRIDVYLLHGFDPQTPQEETFRALDTLVQQGKVRYVGVCNYQAWQVVQGLVSRTWINAAPLITLQNPYSLLNRALEREIFPMVRSQGLGIMAFSPLGVGLLSGAYSPDTMPAENTLWGDQRRDVFHEVLRGRAADVLAEVTAIAERSAATVAQVAQAWVLSHPEITCIISGADTAEQLADNVGALAVQLDPADRASLDTISAGLENLLDGGPIQSDDDED